MRARTVIDADYGDEGKGRTVDCPFASPGSDTPAVRTNGGAQAGHTVVAPPGADHVFHHRGSGAVTHLSRHVVSHLMVLLRERAALAASGANVTVGANPRGFVTTPWT